MTPPAGFEAEFDAWCDNDHVPSRMRAPGFVSAQRYRAHGGAACLTVYDLTSAAALDTPEYRAIKAAPGDTSRWTLQNASGYSRYLGEEIFCQSRTPGDEAVPDLPLLYTVWFNVPADRAPEFNAWYEQEHIPILLRCPEWRMTRRFKIIEGAPERWTHVAVHYLSDLKAMESQARRQARQTPWRDRLAAEPWFKAKYTLFDRHGERRFASPPA